MVVGAAVLGVLVLGIVAYVTTNKGRPKIEVNHSTGATGTAPVRREPAVAGERPKMITNSFGMKLVLVPAGEFLMGSPDNDKEAGNNERPRHQVRITRPFYLGAYEVTRGQFRHFVDDAGYQTEAEKGGQPGWVPDARTKKFAQNYRYTWQTPGFDQSDVHPVVNVSWNDAQAFISWLNRNEGEGYRLPTEAEWEYACRAGSTTRYSFGDAPEELATAGNVADGTAKAKFPNWTCIVARDGYVYTAPVGQYNPNAFGLYDMHGNVWEWCSDGYAADYYKQRQVDDPQGISNASLRVYRGGGYGTFAPVVRSARRITQPPGYRDGNVGFRLALGQYGRWAQIGEGERNKMTK
jgi:formylglycine-generating enzyme required for sulfatase activity